MPIIDPDQGISLVDLADLANNQAAFANFYAGTAGGIKSRTILRYPTRVARGLQHPAPILNEFSIIDGETWLERWTGSKWIPCTPIAKAKTSNQIINNSAAFTNDSELFVPLPAANTWYDVMLLVRYVSNTTADIKFTYTAPAGATVTMAGPGLSTAAAGQTADADFEGITAPTSRPYGGAGGVTISAYKLSATVLTAGTTGNLQLQWAQNTADPSNTTLFNFSTLRVEAIQ